MIPTVPEIRLTFETKPSEYTVSPHPTQAEVKKLRKSLISNLRRLKCVIPGTDPTGWAWILLTPTEWNTIHQNIIDNDPNNADPNVTTPSIPAYPSVSNPGMFTIQDSWSDKRTSKEQSLYNQSLNLFHYKDNICQACLLDLETAIPSELIADLYNENDTLMLSVSPASLLQHMEARYDILKPADIKSVMDTANTPYDESMTMAQYFKRQQKCKAMLASTDVPLTDAALIWTGRGHFERIPFLTRACREWKASYPPQVTPTWSDFKNHFHQYYDEYCDEQATLQEAGIANSALTDAHSSIDTRFSQLEATIANTNNNLLALIAEHQQHQQTCPPVQNLVEPSPPTSLNSSALTNQADVAALAKQIAAALLAPNTTAQPLPSTAPTTTATSKSKRNTSRRPTEPRTSRLYTNMNYCWTHGFDLHDLHTSSTCQNKAPGHKTDATVTNQMGGSTKNLHLVPK